MALTHYKRKVAKKISKLARLEMEENGKTKVKPSFIVNILAINGLYKTPKSLRAFLRELKAINKLHLIPEVRYYSDEVEPWYFVLDN